MTLRRTMQRFRGFDLGPIVALYFIGHGLMLVNKGYYWDDWTFYNIAPVDALGEFVENGNLWFGHYLRLLLAIEPIVSPKVVIFASYLFAAVFLHRVLLTIPEITRQARFFVVLLFALFPVNFARVQVVPCAAYAACYTLFFLGFFFTARFEDDRKLSDRLLAHVSFLTSFFTNSLLVFYALVLLYLGYRSIRGRARRDWWPALLRTPITRSDFVVSPIVFWALKRAFFMSKGPFYEGNYNVVSMSGIATAPLGVLEAFRTSFIEPIAASALATSFVLLLVSAVAAYFLIGADREAPEAPEAAEWNDVIFIALGALAFCLAVFPYIVVGKMPIATDWDSRHQILVPLGASLILYYGLHLAFRLVRLRARPLRAVLCMFAVAFIARNVVIDIAYQKDWFKQMAIVENIRKHPAFQTHMTYLVEDHTLAWNTLERTYRFYEYTGLLKLALGDERHCALDEGELKMFKGVYRILKRNAMLARFNIKDYVYEIPKQRMLLSEGPLAPEPLVFMRLMAAEHFNPAEFRRAVAGLISLDIAPR